MKNKIKVAMYCNNHKYPIKSACEWCNSTEFLQRHHPDYSKPEYYLTLCASCHNKTKNFKHGVIEVLQ